MNYIIKINGYQLELDRDVNFERVIQRNTIDNIADRQSTYTSTIKVYKTGKNYQFFKFLDQPGVDSNLPYIVLRAEILNESGMIVNRKGRAFIEKTDKDYFYLNIYDGFIDFLKKIENKTLNDLDLSLLNHDKNVASVKDSWNDTEKYIYLISDFNGNNIHNAKLNIDYQLPSASVKYIWEQIFNLTGYSYNTGGVFNTGNFEDLYISYPKPITSEVVLVPVIERKNDFGLYIDDYESVQPKILNFPSLFPYTEENVYFKVFAQNSTFSSPLNVTELPYVGEFKKTGIYKLSISGEFYIQDADGITYNCSKIIYEVERVNTVIHQGKLSSLGNDYSNNVDLNVQFGDTIKLYVLNENSFDTNEIQVQFSYFFSALHDKAQNSTFLTNYSGNSNLGITTKIEYFDSQSVDFADVFGSIKIRDFIKEIMLRFGLTPFPDHKRNHIDFLLQESIFLSDVIDYSNNFIREEEISFAYNDYAQKNYYRYKYNDKEADHNDGSIDVVNENLDFEKDFYKSFLYSPVKGESEILTKQFIKSKAWERKIDEDSNVEYEELDGRFYIFRKELVNEPIDISSVEFGNSDSANSFYRASFDGLDYNDILTNEQGYYRFIDGVIKRSKIRNVILKLTDLEFMMVDIMKKVYIKQYSKEFLINRIKDKSGENDYLFELIEINKIIKVKPNQPPTIILTGGDMAITEGEQYNEPGFAASDNEDGNITSQVQVSDNIDNNTPGTYTITYSVTDSGGLTDSKTRTVYVNAAPEPNQAPVITLGGGSVTIGIGESFTEPGFAASDNEDGNITSQVQVSDNIDNQTPGEYQVTYTVTDSGGLTDTKTRTVQVLETYWKGVNPSCETVTI